MKYAYDKGFKKIAVNMPFSGLFCKLSHKPLEKMLKRIKLPQDITVREFTIDGYGNEPVRVMEIVPSDPGDGAILVLHGGGFGYKTSPHQLLNACCYASKLHCRAYLPDYHLLPKYPFPAAYEDVMSTYKYIVSHVAELSINPDKIFVLGDSAGGALAANVCNMAQQKGLPMPCCQVLIYPVVDDEMKTESMKRFTDTPLWNAKNNRKMWGMYLKNATDEEMRVAVPVKNPLPKHLPPTYIETAEFDCLHDEAICYAKHIEGVAKKIEIYETKGTIHGYDTLSAHPIAQESMRKRIEFMARVLTQEENK